MALVPATSAKLPSGGSRMEGASGAHRRRPVVERGQAAVRAAVAAVTGQISLLTAEVSRQLERRRRLHELPRRDLSTDIQQKLPTLLGREAAGWSMSTGGDGLRMMPW
ncbi:hypothetical protein BCD49_37655 [Pseudofrankia sp. EUN1h]|nr:hypothetical protein BCD49_37655 [Pseudofrankia sp. EUN1h]